MIKYRYVGDRAFHCGIPARDLTEADWAQLSPEQQQVVKNSPLYEPAVKATPKKAEPKVEAKEA